MNSIQMRPLQMGYYVMELVETGTLWKCSVFNTFVSVVKDGAVASGRGRLPTLDEINWLLILAQTKILVWRIKLVESVMQDV